MKTDVNNVRLESLDTLRGADMLFIMGFSAALIALCQLLGFGKDCWLATQMTHVVWHGFRHHDTIFPLFLFLAGVAWPFSYASQVAKGRTTGQILRKIGFRVAALIVLGLFGSALFSFQYEKFRYDSVLAHIGVCWGASAVIFMFVRNFYVRLILALLLLLGHWLVLIFFTAPDAAALLSSSDPVVAKHVAKYAGYGTDCFSFTGNIAGWIDRTIMPGRLHEVGIFDPDGLLGKMTGIVTAMLGVFSGELLRKENMSGARKTLILVAAGAVSLALCLAWKPWCPVNKKIWTSTFILAAGAYSFFSLALFYWIVDVKKWRSWTLFFRVIGMNSITIYIMMRFVGFNQMSRYFFSGIAGLGGAQWHTLVILVGQIMIEWLVLYYLYRKKTFLKV